MNRRLLSAAFGATMIVAAVIPATTSARTPQTHTVATRVAKPSIDTRLHAGMLADKVGNVMLELTGAPVVIRQADAKAAGGSLTTAQRTSVRKALKSTQDALRAKITAAGGRILGQYQDAYNGIKVRVNLRQVTKLAALPGVKAVHAIQILSRDNTNALPYIGVPAAWQATGFTGLGVKIAIIDTGIDYYHADFGGSGDPTDYTSAVSTTLADGGFPTAKVAGGFDFAGNNYDANGEEGLVIPAPDPDPLDCGPADGGDGHGTHVAGTAAGEGVLANGSTFSGPYNATTISGNSWKVGPGVAPQATLYSFKVFGCKGSTDLTVDAINAAVAAGVDVINMSLGSPLGEPSPDDPSSVASDNAVRAGVVVVASAGNSGPNAYAHGSPAAATGVISAAALDALPTFPAAIVQGAGSAIPAIDMNSAPLPLSGAADAITATSTTLKLGCDAADYTGFTPGNIAIVQRGSCPFVDKGALAQAAGAIAIVIVNRDDTDPGALPAFIGATPGFFTIPMIGTDKTAKAALIGADGDPITLASGGTLTNPTYRNTADFSSGGPREGDSFLKPDVTAPGVSISSAFVGSGTGAQTLSGTSMAAPNTTGVAALVIQAHPTWAPTLIKALIMNTASASSSLIVGYDPRLNGSGVVQPRRAVDSVAVATTGWGEASLSFGYDPRVLGLSDTRTLKITNTSGRAISYRLTSSFVGDDLGATIHFSHANVTVAAHSSRLIKVTIRIKPSHMADLPGADALPTEAVLAIEGAVKATPTVGGRGRYQLRIPFLVVPRSLSAVSATGITRFTVASGVATGTIKLTNPGLHSGNADVYSWGYGDPMDGIAEADIRAVGVQALPGAFGGLSDDDRLLGFAVNTYGRWTDAANNEFDVLVDTNHDGTPDFVVIAADSGLVLTGSSNGQVLGFVVDLSDGSLVGDPWTVSAPTNGSTIVIYAAASDFGLADGSGPIGYSVDSFSLEGFGDDATSGNATFDPFHPAVSQGDFVGLDHNDVASLPVTVGLAQFAATPSLGWMIVTMDDPNGGRQADLVSISGVGSDTLIHGRVNAPLPTR